MTSTVSTVPAARELTGLQTGAVAHRPFCRFRCRTRCRVRCRIRCRVRCGCW